MCYASEEGRGKGDGGRGGVEKSKKRGVIDGEDKEAAMRRKKQVRGGDRSIETLLFDFKRIEYSDHSPPWVLQGNLIFLYWHGRDRSPNNVNVRSGGAGNTEMSDVAQNSLCLVMVTYVCQSESALMRRSNNLWCAVQFRCWR